VEVFAIRHGETAWSLSEQHTGKTDTDARLYNFSAFRDSGY
jgi:broad specificity phosphatase PhoE